MKKFGLILFGVIIVLLSLETENGVRKDISSCYGLNISGYSLSKPLDLTENRIVVLEKNHFSPIDEVVKR